MARPTGPPGCPIPQWVALVYANWSNPAPDAIQISSTNDATSGTAVCLAPTDGAVTLTGTFGPGGVVGTTPIAKTVQLTCE
ncbi:MAG: hypothetical protein ACRD3N_11135 [Terracidiphilus sp.]